MKSIQKCIQTPSHFLKVPSNSNRKRMSASPGKEFLVQEAKRDEELQACYPCVAALRTHVTQSEFIPRVKGQWKEGFHLMYILDPSSGKVGSCLGYRTLNLLYSGKTLYVDDLSSLPESRGKGHAGALLRWTQKYAQENGYDAVTLDSGCNPGRYDAHRLYMNCGFNISSHHFYYTVPKPSQT